jgi:NAD(P)-dependent dehydrogenase (short-subunit alcohol dehydrogenase family)
MQKFTDKVAIVTGATSGIGRATAIAFAKNGAKVTVAGRRESEGLETVAMIKKLGGEAIFIKTDVRKEEDVEAMVAQTIKIYGRLDYAYNNAGIGTTAPLFDETEEDYYTVMDTNIKGTFLCMKYEIREMMKNKRGVIINASSAASEIPVPTHSFYNASKAAIISLTQTAAAEVAQFGIRINAVCAIGIAGRMVDAYLNETGTKLEEIIPPVGRIGTPEDVANTVLFLCSDEASYFTGAKISPDGGMSIKF